MAVDIETIGVAVDSSGVVKGTKELDKFGKAADAASREADKLGKVYDRQGKLITDSTIRQARAHAENEKALRSSQNATSGLTSGLKSLAAAYIGLQSAAALVRTIDEYTKFNAQLKLATRSQSEYAAALSDVQRISTVAQASLNGIGVLYARINNAVRDLGVSQAAVAKITENVGLALKVSGATASESASAMLQLSQAFGSGVLRGEEFNAVNEAAPALMRALAESMGVPIGQLRELASEGQITADVLVKAFGDDNLLNKFREQAKEVQTLSGAWQTFKNNFIIYIGEMDASIGASKFLARLMNFTGEVMFPKSVGVKEKQKRELSGLLQRQEEYSFYTPEYLKREDAARISQLRRELGITPKSQFQPSTGLLPNGMIAPNFGVTKKDGEGGYDARVNNQKELDEQKKNYQKLIDDKKQKEKQFLDYRNRLEAELNKTAEDMGVAALKTRDKIAKEEYERQQKYMELLQKQANANFDEAQKKAKELADEVNKVSDEISRSLTDALYRGFEKGKSFLQNFVDTLKNTFKTLILQPVIKFLVDSSGIAKVIAAIGGSLSGNALAGETGGGIGGIFKSVTDVFSSGNASIVSSIQDLGVYLSNGNGGLGDVIGGFLGEYSSQIADGFGYFGAALQLAQGNIGGAAGAAIGTAFGGPLGGAIGSFLGGALGGLFGGKSYKRYGSTVSGEQKAGGEYQKTGQGIIYDRSLGVENALDGINESFSKTIAGFLGAFDIQSNINTSSGMYQRGKSKKSGGIFRAAIDGVDIGAVDVVLRKASLEEVYNALVEKVLGEGLVQAIKVSSLSDGVKKFFDGLTKKEDVQEAITTLMGLKMALADLPPIFNAVRNAIDTTAYTTSIEALKAQFEATQNFVNLFYTDAEKFDIFTDQLNTQLEALNQTLPSSRDEYRALVESINVVDEATRDQFNGLIALAPAMNEYFGYLQKQREEIEALNGALRGSEYFTTLTDFQRYQGVARNFGGVAANDTLIRDSALMVGELKALRAEIVALRTANESTATSSKKTADLLTQVTEDGNALLTVAA